jgi:protein gp37
MPKNNMYDWITGTWNPLAGECPHKCVYCSTKSIPWKSVREKYSGELRLDEKTMTKNLGHGKAWFVCAQNDLFADLVPDTFIDQIFHRCFLYSENQYVFQTKNPGRYLRLMSQGFCFPKGILGCTIESTSLMRDIATAPDTYDRVVAMKQLRYRKFITIEPIINNFDVKVFAGWIKQINPEFVNIGADSKKHNLPEPSADKIKALIAEIQNAGIEIREKHNLERLLK